MVKWIIMCVMNSYDQCIASKLTFPGKSNSIQLEQSHPVLTYATWMKDVQYTHQRGSLRRLINVDQGILCQKKKLIMNIKDSAKISQTFLTPYIKVQTYTN